MNEKLRDSLRNDLRRKMQTSQSALTYSQKNTEHKHQVIYKPQEVQQTKVEKSQQHRILAKEKIEETRAAAEKYYNSRSSYANYMDKYYADKQAEQNKDKT